MNKADTIQALLESTPIAECLMSKIFTYANEMVVCEKYSKCLESIRPNSKKYLTNTSKYILNPYRGMRDQSYDEHILYNDLYETVLLSANVNNHYIWTEDGEIRTILRDSTKSSFTYFVYPNGDIYLRKYNPKPELRIYSINNMNQFDLVSSCWIMNINLYDDPYYWFESRWDEFMGSP